MKFMLGQIRSTCNLKVKNLSMYDIVFDESYAPDFAYLAPDKSEIERADSV